MLYCFQKKNKILVYLMISGLLLNIVVVFVPSSSGETWENQYGKLEVYPVVSTGIITQVQYCNLTSYVDSTEIDVAFRFDMPIGNPDIWIWRNISHDVWVIDYGYLFENFTLYNISDFTVLTETPDDTNFGDIPSDHYAEGNVTYWNEIQEIWERNFVVIGFDSWNWQNPEHTICSFSSLVYGVTGRHQEEQYYFDWDSIKDKFYHDSYPSGEYYYVRDWMIKDKLYQFKWQYDIPLGSNGKWDLMAKKSSDSTWRVSIDPYWNSSWEFSKRINLINNIEGHQLRIEVSNNTGFGDINLSGYLGQADFTDVRFITADNSSEIYHWMEHTNKTDNENATFWVNNSGNDTYYYIYFGNPTCSNSSYKDGNNTFWLFDDFIGSGAVDGSTWYPSGTPLVAGGNLVLADDDIVISADKYPYESRTRNYIDVDSLDTVGASDSYMIHYQLNGDNKFWILNDDGGGHLIDEYWLVTKESGTTEQTWKTGETALVWNSYMIEYYYNTHCNFYQNDVLLEQDTARILNSGSEDLMMRAYDASQEATMYIDWVFVGLYALTEPSISSVGNLYSIPTITAEVPADESIDIAVTPTLNVTVNDVDNDYLNVTWLSNSSGAWVWFARNSSIDGATLPLSIVQVNSNFSAYDTTYYWSVNVSDGSYWTNETYKFTTLVLDLNDPVQSNNATSNLTITWNVTITDNGGAFDWSIECNGQSNSSSGDSNGSKSITLYNLSENTTYTVFVNVSDTFSNWNNETYTFIIGNLSAVDTTLFIVPVADYVFLLVAVFGIAAFVGAVIYVFNKKKQ